MPFYFTQMQCYGSPDPESVGFADIRQVQHMFFMNNLHLHDGENDITDLVYIVTCMFQTGHPLNCNNYICDYDSNGITDISDLVDFVDYMFSSGPPPPEY